MLFNGIQVTQMSSTTFSIADCDWSTIQQDLMMVLLIMHFLMLLKYVCIVSILIGWKFVQELECRNYPLRNLFIIIIAQQFLSIEYHKVQMLWLVGAFVIVSRPITKLYFKEIDRFFIPFFIPFYCLY